MLRTLNPDWVFGIEYPVFGVEYPGGDTNLSGGIGEYWDVYFSGRLYPPKLEGSWGIGLDEYAS